MNENTEQQAALKSSEARMHAERCGPHDFFVTACGGHSDTRNPAELAAELDANARYIVRACNAYPKLVALLARIHEVEEGPGETDRPLMIELRTLFRELGEQL